MISLKHFANWNFFSSGRTITSVTQICRCSSHHSRFSRHISIPVKFIEIFRWILVNNSVGSRLGVNPLLYAILSRNFRKGMSELLICSFKPNKNKSLNKRTVTHVSKINSILLRHSNGNADKIHHLSENAIEFESTCHDFAPHQ